jgi:hypothetical protein
MACPAVTGGIAPGHYKLSFVDRYAPRNIEMGAGRIRIADLTLRDIKGLMFDERVEETLDDDFYRIGGRKGFVGALGGVEDEAPFTRLGPSIHGGGETLTWTQSGANFQPLTTPPKGVRVHNSDLAKLMNYLEPRLRCLQIVIFSIL